MDVEFLFDFGSPNAYLAHKAIPLVEARSDIRFHYVPVLIGAIFKATGNQSPAFSTQGISNKPEYLGREMQRFARKYGVDSFRFNPFFPVNTLQIMRGAVVANRADVFAAYVDAVFDHMWGDEPKKMDDPEVIEAALGLSGLPARAILDGMSDPAVKQQLIDNTDNAVERGVFGLPAFFVGGELYFGKETLRELEDDTSPSS
jgi:2-hydroxychromene-2-carboxylate isomerase